MPLVEFTRAIQRCQTIKRAGGLLEPPRSHERRHIKSTYKWPDTAVVIVVGQVQGSIIVTPIGVAGPDDRSQASQRRITQAFLFDEVKDAGCLRLIRDVRK